MEDVGGIVGAAVAALTTVGGGVAWMLRRHDGKKDPIPKESAAVALAQSSVTIMRGVADELRGDLANERQQRAALYEEVSTLRVELSTVRKAQESADEAHAQTREALEETQGDVQWLRSTLGTAAAYIERLLRWARSESRPPIPPLPTDLRNLIDPSLHNFEED